MDIIKDLRYVLCPGSLPDPKYSEDYKKIYNCWRDVWSEAFKELGVTKPMYSDSFTRQDYIGAIFYKNECVALAFYRWTDAKREDFSKDSYFFNWSEEHQKMLRSRGDRVVVCSYFTVHPAARGSKIGVSGKDLLMGMIVETFMNSKADAMTGAVRVNRKVNDAGLKWGAYLIEGDIPSGAGDATVDLIGFFKDHISAQPRQELKDLTTALWNERLQIHKVSLSHEFSDSKEDAKTFHTASDIKAA